MRFIAVILIVVGLGVVYGLPYYNAQFANFEITSQSVSPTQDSADGFEVDLAQIDSPLVLHLDLRFSDRAITRADTMIVPVAINGESGAVLATTVEITGLRHVPGREKPDEEGHNALDYSYRLAPVSLTQNGIHRVEIGPVVENGMTLSRASVTLIGNASTIGPYDTVGWIVFGVGVLGFVLSGRRRKIDQPTREPPKNPGRMKASDIGRARPLNHDDKKTSQAPPQKWGRGEDG